MESRRVFFMAHLYLFVLKEMERTEPTYCIHVNHGEPQINNPHAVWSGGPILLAM